MKTIDEYIETHEPEIQKTLNEIRNFIKTEVPVRVKENLKKVKKKATHSDRVAQTVSDNPHKKASRFDTI